MPYTYVHVRMSNLNAICLVHPFTNLRRKRGASHEYSNKEIFCRLHADSSVYRSNLRWTCHLPTQKLLDIDTT